MTHIDPFAPADSPQHPANWTPDQDAGEQQGEPINPGTPLPEAMPYWIQLVDEPVYSDNPDAALIGDARWEEYGTLLEQHGTDAQKAMWQKRMEEWDDDTMPTLAQLREMHDQVVVEPEGGAPEGETREDGDDPAPAPDPAQDEDPEAELAAALAKLEGGK